MHCRSCVIRSAVADTFDHDNDHEHLPATRDVVTPEGAQAVRFRISTEKFGGLVLLRIDSAQPLAA